MDADVDAAPPSCDPTAPFGEPKLVLGLEELAISSARFTSDETTVLFSALNGCPQETCVDLFIATRKDLSSPFLLNQSSAPLRKVNTSVTSEYWPTLTASALLLFFESSRSVEKVDGSYTVDLARIWSSKRVDPLDEFDEATIQSIFAVDGGSEISPYLHPEGQSLYFGSTARPGKGNFDIWVATLNDKSGLAVTVQNVAAVNTEVAELYPVVTRDDRVLYFAREDAITSIRDIYVTKRTDPDSPFGAVSPVTELNGPYEDFPSWISDDQCRFYFVSDRPPLIDATPGTGRLWVAARPK